MRIVDYIVILFVFFISCNNTNENNDIGIAVLSGEIIELSDNGAWVWHTSPSVLHHKKSIYYSYVDTKDRKKIMLSSIDIETKKKHLIEVSTEKSFATDSHDHPALLILPNQKMFISYNRHKMDEGFFYRTSITEEPKSIEDFSDESFFYYESEKNTCYSNLFYLKNEGKIFNFCRWLNSKPTLVYSTDLGATWSKPKIFINSNGVRPYVHYFSNSKNRIDMIYNEGHPGVEKNSVYHFYYNKNKFFNSNGDVIGSDDSIEFIVGPDRPGGIVYKYSEEDWTDKDDIHRWIPFGRAWVWDIKYNSDNNPVCVFSVRVSPNKFRGLFYNDRIMYYYAWWSKGKGWQKKCIANGGSPLYEKEKDFAGGICINPNNTSEVYFSSNVKNIFNMTSIWQSTRVDKKYKLYKGVFDLNSEEITINLFLDKSNTSQIRPIVPIGNEDYSSVLWMEGDYQSYKKYNTKIMGWFKK